MTTAPRSSRALLPSLVALVLALAPRGASAHDLRPGVLSLVERSPGSWKVRFVPPIDSRGEVTSVTLEPVAHCRLAGTDLACSDGTAELRVIGMRDPMRTVVVRARASGERDDWV